MKIKVSGVNKILVFFLLSAVGYQVVWHFAFQFIFYYQYIVEYAKNIVFIKLLGELLLYAIFSVRFALLSAEVNKRLKYFLFSLAFSLWLLTFYASIKTI